MIILVENLLVRPAAHNKSITNSTEMQFPDHRFSYQDFGVDNDSLLPAHAIALSPPMLMAISRH